MSTPSIAQPPASTTLIPPQMISPSLNDNPYFSAGAGLVGIGIVVSFCRSMSIRALRLAERRLFTTLEIPSRDHSYQWVMQWLIANSHHARHLGVETTLLRDASGHTTTTFDYIPSTGRHWMKFNRTHFLVERVREKSMVDLQAGLPFETLKLTTLAQKRDELSKLLIAARDKALRKEEGRTIIYHSAGQEWRPFGTPKKIRPFSSVILSDNVAESLKEDVKKFLASDRWYFDRGIPYRRGYLLYGPPGCGKSSYVTALAGELQYNICILNVSDPFLTDDRLNYLLATVPPRALVLLEDIDGAIAAHEAAAAESSSCPKKAPPPVAGMNNGVNPYGLRHNVTFSGLLNALDGVVATEERIVFMTTNHLHRLPESLIRPGRVDVKVFIGWATKSQLRRMFLRFFPDHEAHADEFCTSLRHLRLSVAEVQGFFLCCKNAPDEALRLAKQWGSASQDNTKTDGNALTATSASP